MSSAWVPGDDLAGFREWILTGGRGQRPFTATEAARLLGIDQVNLAAFRRDGGILGLPVDTAGELAFPRWQFDPQRPTRPLRGLEAVLPGLGSMDPWGVADFLLTRHPALGGESPLERLRRSDGQDASRVREIVASKYR